MASPRAIVEQRQHDALEGRCAQLALADSQVFERRQGRDASEAQTQRHGGPARDVGTLPGKGEYAGEKGPLRRVGINLGADHPLGPRHGQMLDFGPRQTIVMLLGFQFSRSGPVLFVGRRMGLLPLGLDQLIFRHDR